MSTEDLIVTASDLASECANGLSDEVVIELGALCEKLLDILTEVTDINIDLDAISVLEEKLCEIRDLIADDAAGSELSICCDTDEQILDKLCEVADLLATDATGSELSICCDTDEQILEKVCELTDIISETIVECDGDPTIAVSTCLESDILAKLCQISDQLQAQITHTELIECCDEEPLKVCTPLLFETRTDTAWIDNHTFPNRPTGPVVYPWDDHNVTVNFSDGTSCTVFVPGNSLIGGGAPYVQWNVDFAAILAAKTGKGWARFVGPGDDNNDSTPFVNAVGASCCPGEVVPISATAVRTNADKPARTVVMAVGVITGDTEKVVGCVCCDGPLTWTNSDGEPIEKPSCIYPCGQPPQGPNAGEPECEVTLTGPLCDIDAEPATATPDDVVRSDIFYALTVCDDGSQVELIADDGTGNQVTYTPVGYIGNCDNLTEVTPPTAPCSIDDAVTLKTVGGCETAFQVTTGRPNNAVAWELVGPNGPEVTGTTYADFSANMAAAGYTSWINGEAHWYCPCPEGAIGQPQGTYYVTADGDTQTKILCVSANEVEGAPASEAICVVSTEGCNDDRRDDLLGDIKDKLCEDECQWLVLCDENGNEWLTQICDPDGEVTTVVGVTPPGPLVCTFVRTYCGRYGAYAQCDDLASFTVDGTATPVPANWATMTEAERTAWLMGLFNTHATGATVTGDVDTGLVCWTDVDHRPTVSWSQSAPTCRFLVALSVSIRQVCSQEPGNAPEGELTPCPDSDTSIVAIDGCCDGIATTELIIFDGNEILNTVYDQNGDILADCSGFTPTPCDPLGANCETPIFTTECPEPVCPEPTVIIWCDGGEDGTGTQYVDVASATEICGPTGTFVAADWFASPQAQTPFTPTGIPQLCEDAVVKDQECFTDECGTKFSCLTTITIVNGTPHESQVCVPYIEPDCGDEEEGEGNRVAKVERKAIKATKSLHASIKLTATAVNTSIKETIEVKGELAAPIGQLCPCACNGEGSSFPTIAPSCGIGTGGPNVPGGTTATAVGSRPNLTTDIVTLAGGSAGPITTALSTFPDAPVFKSCGEEPWGDTAITLGQTGTAPQVCVDINSIQNSNFGIGFALADTATNTALPVISSGDWNALGGLIVDTSSGTNGLHTMCFDATGVADLSTLVLIAYGVGGANNDPEACDEFELVNIDPPPSAGEDPISTHDACLYNQIGELCEKIEALQNKAPAPTVIEDCDGMLWGINPADGSIAWGPIPSPGA